jgi:ubiquinone/menaquinone biosynthesis C-methylase UbiE
MPDNTNRFTGRAEDYDRYRQRYPTGEVLSRLREWCGLTPEWIVADIGAGTGMLAEVFLENGNRVLAVEPNQDMRDQMRASVEQQLGKPTQQLEIVDAMAEDTKLPAASVDLVAAWPCLPLVRQGARARRVPSHPKTQRLGDAGRCRSRPRRNRSGLSRSD